MNIIGIGLSVAVLSASLFLQVGTGIAYDTSPGFGEKSDNIQLAQGRYGGRRGFCDQYAKSAVDHNRQNIRRGCGYTGDRWHSSYQQHFDWCMEVDRAAADSEAGVRADDLARCGSGGRGNREFCRNYAKSAVKQNERNERRNCGFAGDRWHSNFEDHFRWCLDVERAAAESEANVRDDELRACRRGR